MAANSPLVRPLGILAGGLGAFQGLVWFVLSLLAILTYTEVIGLGLADISVTELPAPSSTFRLTLVSLYFRNSTVGLSDLADTMTAGVVVIWSSLYLAVSVIWLVASGLLLRDFMLRLFSRAILIGWVAVTAAVCALDFAATVSFGVDYSRMQTYVDKYPTRSSELLLPPAFMMTLSARGFVLWLLNVSLVIYLAMAITTGEDEEPSLKEGEEVSPSLIRRPSFSSFRSSLRGDPYDKGRQNPAYQPDSLSAWNVQSPTVGAGKRGPWDFPEYASPKVTADNNFPPTTPIFPRVGRPVSTPTVPVASVSPLPTPQPDYSPILGQRLKREPNFNESPLRPALKKSTQYGRTIL
ncbi:uncharacterized protein [Periplaneta americana]|uniref:uncharacterized protein n=1 Tax=Periplaneta americana TaxID=6978 RepID=UPI0037E834A7